MHLEMVDACLMLRFLSFSLAVTLLRNKVLPNPGDHLQDFHWKSDENRTSALFYLDMLLRSSFVRFKPPWRYVLFRVCFTSFHGGKWEQMHWVQSLKAGDYFDAKNWAFDAKFAKIKRGQNCCYIFAGKQAAFLVTIIIGYNAINTGNNVASLQYNNSNRKDRCCHAGRMLRWYWSKKTDREMHSQPFNGINFILL